MKNPTKRGPKPSPIEVEVWGNPEQYNPTEGMHWIGRLNRLFEANLGYRFHTERLTRQQLLRMSVHGALFGVVGYPRSHAFNTHGLVTIDGQGPFDAIYVRDWSAPRLRAVPPYAANRKELTILPGVLLAPNGIGVDPLTSYPATVEAVCRGLYDAWVAATGTVRRTGDKPSTP
ncbi:hypothetical protein [Mesorhizobium sp. Root552]|uniref:hypothetical protein n=1 Tax=Mesorhizobium sp. Root552 TaxID=1736555 RepID=UPI0012E8065F|nr:hypothetical protein [Mesorhizobium sp. Root552]